MILVPMAKRKSTILARTALKPIFRPIVFSFVASVAPELANVRRETSRILATELMITFMVPQPKSSDPATPSILYPLDFRANFSI